MKQLEQTLKETNTRYLLKMINSDKEYFLFDISVFNVGARIDVICTNNYKESNLSNGYNFYLCNDFDTIYLIEKELERRYLDYVNNFLTLDRFCEYYNISLNVGKKLINKFK